MSASGCVSGVDCDVPPVEQAAPSGIVSKAPSVAEFARRVGLSKRVVFDWIRDAPGVGAASASQIETFLGPHAGPSDSPADERGTLRLAVERYDRELAQLANVSAETARDAELLSRATVRLFDAKIRAVARLREIEQAEAPSTVSEPRVIQRRYVVVGLDGVEREI